VKRSASNGLIGAALNLDCGDSPENIPGMEMAVVMERWRRSSIFCPKSFYLASMLFALALGGCTMADSTIVDRHVQYPPGSVVCSSTLGSYALPKSFIHVVIGRTGNTPPDLVTTQDTLPDGKFNFDIVRRADPALTVCLDYLASIFSHDEISVTKQSIDLKVDDGTSATTSRQFLRSVIVNASDKSVQIARNLMQAAFVSLSGNPDFGVGTRKVLLPTDKAAILADLEFDPFDARDSAEANARLSGLGFCLVLEGFTYDRGSMSIDQYCNSPYRVRDHIPRIAELYAVKSREPIAPNTSGVLYRPRQTYMISVYQRNGGRGPWHLSRRVDVNLENLSPVISVGISRAIFARRNAALMFEDGVLNTVCIAKTSEIENFVAIPFEISRSLVALPSQIVKVKINRIAKEEELARVENLYIQTQAALLKTLAGQQADKPTGNTTPADTPKVVDKIFDSPALDENANIFTIDDTSTKAWIDSKCGEKLTVAPDR
jgi:hypothetical protein